MEIEIDEEDGMIWWKYNKNDKWIKANVDDLVRAYESQKRGNWILTDKSGAVCSQCHRLNKSHGYYCKFCGSDNIRGDEND